MGAAKPAQSMSLALVLLVGCCGPTLPVKDSAPDDGKWGPARSEQELEVISELSTTKSVGVLRQGDTLHKFAALQQLTIDKHRQQNFDPLLSIAAEGE